jgi:hypothetical protein
MGEPKFSDAPCYGKEFKDRSKACRVCLANRSCQRIFYKRLGATKREEGLQSFPELPWNKRLSIQSAVKPVLPKAA